MEAHTFASITARSKELSTLAGLFSGPGRHRRSLLRQLHYNVGLPTHGDLRRDHATNERAFGAAVKSLFDLLGSWDRDVDDEGASGVLGRASLELNLWLSYDVNTDAADGPVDHAFDVCNSSAARRYHTLRPPDLILPPVQRVTRFRVHASLGRAPHPATLCRLAGHFPLLESLDLTYWDPAVKRHEVRREHRVALGEGLRALSGTLLRLERLCIRRQDGADPCNHSFACGDLREDGVDVLCDAIRHLAQARHLRELQLENIIVPPDLFRSSPSSTNGGTPDADHQSSIFPGLRRLDIKCGILAPSGEWYYTGDPAAVEADAEGDLVLDDDDDDDDSESDDNSSGSGDEDSSTRDRFVNGERPHHEWRTRPDPETFDALVRDMTDAVLGQMPSLEWAQLDTGSNLTGCVGIIIQCCVAGQPFVSPPGKNRNRPWVEDTTVRRCKAWVGEESEWDVPPDVTAKWRGWAGASGSVEMDSRP